MTLAQSLTGCWKGRRDDGRLEVLRVERRDWGVELLIATGDMASCGNVFSFIGLNRTETGVVAYSRLAGQSYAWIVSASPETILFTPANAPVWMRLKRLDEKRIEWSSAGYTSQGQSYVDPTILEHVEPPAPSQQ